MPRGPAPAWRARKQPVADDWVFASINEAGGKFDPDTGFYATIRMRMDPGDDITEWHRALRRSAAYLCRNGVADIGIHCELKRDKRGRYIDFAAVNKQHTYLYVIKRYGADRSKWPYDPRRRANPKQDSKPDARPGWPPQGRVPMDVLRQIEGMH